MYGCRDPWGLGEGRPHSVKGTLTKSLLMSFPKELGMGDIKVGAPSNRMGAPAESKFGGRGSGAGVDLLKYEMPQDTSPDISKAKCSGMTCFSLLPCPLSPP